MNFLFRYSAPQNCILALIINFLFFYILNYLTVFSFHSFSIYLRSFKELFSCALVGHHHNITTSPQHHIITTTSQRHHNITSSPHHHNITTSPQHHIITTSPHHYYISSSSPHHAITSLSHHHHIINLIIIPPSSQ